MAGVDGLDAVRALDLAPTQEVELIELREDLPDLLRRQRQSGSHKILCEIPVYRQTVGQNQGIQTVVLGQE